LAQTGYIDYDKLEEKAMDFRPKMIISGGSAYPREWDYKRLRDIANKVGSLLMTDMAHIRSPPPPPLSSSLVFHTVLLGFLLPPLPCS